MDMRSYTLALILSVGVFLAGLSSGYIYVYAFKVNPKVLLGMVMETAPAQATVTRAEAVSQAVQTIAEVVAPQPTQPKKYAYILFWDTIKYVSTSLGILSTNIVTAFGAAVTPLLPVLWQRKITPWFMRFTGKRDDPDMS